jgi:hypothetical protein
VLRSERRLLALLVLVLVLVLVRGLVLPQRSFWFLEALRR